MAGPLDLIAEAKRLVRFDTSTWQSNADCAVHAGNLFRKLGMEVRYQESRQGEALFLNVVGMIGQGKGPILLATHLDTVSPGDPSCWTKTGGDPWRLTARGDSLYGLGAADTKLDLLAKLAAVAALKRARIARSLLLVGTFGEESGLRGAARFCQGDLPKPAMALVGEPTDLALVTRHKGLAVVEVILMTRGLYRPESAQWVYEVQFQGRASHSSTPALGENAISMAIRFLERLKARTFKVSLLSWEGGEGHNMIPASCRLRFSLGEKPRQGFPAQAGQRVTTRRLLSGWYPTLPWSDLLEAVRIIGSALAPLEKAKEPGFEPGGLTWNVTRLKEEREGWTLTADIRPLPGQSLQPAIRRLEKRLWERFGAPGPQWQFRLERDNPPLDLEAGSPLLRLARTAARAARIPPKVCSKAGCSEAGLYQRVGSPSLVFGPGRAVGNIHRPNEVVSLRQIKRAIRFYEEFLKRVCASKARG